MISNKTSFIKSSCFFLLVLSCLVSSCKDSKNKIKPKNIEKGELLFTSVGCATCHSLSGEDNLYGPSLNLTLGSNIKVIRKEIEYSIVIDRAYIKRSIVNPDFEKPIPFQSNKMPIPTLTDFEIDCIVDYLIALNSK